MLNLKNLKKNEREEKESKGMSFKKFKLLPSALCVLAAKVSTEKVRFFKKFHNLKMLRMKLCF